MPFVKGDPNINREGRPKGKTMKEFAREYFLLKSEEDKIAYIENLEKKKPGFAWEMGEGKAKQDTETELKGNLVIKLVNYGSNDTAQLHSKELPVGLSESTSEVQDSSLT